jgi:hypothetical protein
MRVLSVSFCHELPTSFTFSHDSPWCLHASTSWRVTARTFLRLVMRWMRTSRASTRRHQGGGPGAVGRPGLPRPQELLRGTGVW